MVEHTDLKPPQPWRREPNERLAQVLLKLAEECNELAGACVRANMQGINGIDPSSGRTNYANIEREIADVDALIQLAIPMLAMSLEFIGARSKAKKAHKREWLDGISTAPRIDPHMTWRLVDALEGIVAEFDKFSRYGSPIAQTANERVSFAKATLAACKPPPAGP